MPYYSFITKKTKDKFRPEMHPWLAGLKFLRENKASSIFNQTNLTWTLEKHNKGGGQLWGLKKFKIASLQIFGTRITLKSHLNNRRSLNLAARG